MRYICDFHIHSKYSRATSKKTDIENLEKWAKIKGVSVLGTGDFTHPEWLEELKAGLEPAEEGLFACKGKQDGVRFILTAEISCIYAKNDKIRKIHIVVFAPSFEVVDEINKKLFLIGNLRSDGRPILGLDSKELLKIILDSSPDCLFVPAHCLLPDTFLHSNSGIKKIKDISIGDKVYTHHGRLKKVKQVYTRFYKGPIYNIKPNNFTPGLQTTEEHPFYLIKTYKSCKNCSHTICKPTCAYYQKRRCSHPYFKKYHPRWVRVKDIEKGDVLIFPRFNNNIKDVDSIKLSDFLRKREYKLREDKILLLNSRAKELPNQTRITKELCRLVGYYISEGYTDNRDSISFCFNRDERKYIKDLKFLMNKAFNFSSPRIYKRKNTNGIEIIYFSKILASIFSKLFYNSSIVRRAHTKCLPYWMLNLPLEKQVEIFKGWWRGDAGVTSSRELMNQMKIILLRLGIIPSIREQTKENFNTKYAHKYKLENRIIKAQHNQFTFHNLSFLQDFFGLLRASEFRKFNTKLSRRHCWIDEKYIYIPVRDIEIKNYEGKVYNLEVEEDNSYLSEFATIHNCMTPWFGVFGSKSGFDSIEECFEDYSKYIYALETGLSADPAMLWRISKLDNITLISNSDAHSPQKIGREANVFEGENLSYGALIGAIKEAGGALQKSPLKLVSTVEFFPEEGKYHFDGHRLCQIRLSPEERKKHGGICPNCGKQLTVGVLSRVDELADRKEGEKSVNAIPFKKLVPLGEIISKVFNLKSTNSKRVEIEYKKLIGHFGNEFNVLIEAPIEEISKISFDVAKAVKKVREENLTVIPGYDGEYGKVEIEDREKEEKQATQKTLF